MKMDGLRQIRLTGRSARFLQMLQDFGHLDAPGCDTVVMALSEQYGTPETPAVVDLLQVRAIVATLLVDMPRSDDMALSEDWGPLFH